MLPDVARMDAATAAALAQVVPVLMLTLLFEIPVRRRVRAARPRTRWLLLGFVLNLAIGGAAVAAEFGLLGVVQHDGVLKDAEFVWITSFALFVIVMLRWAATTALGQLVRENGPLLVGGIAAFRESFLEGVAGVLLSPASAIGEVLQITGEAAFGTLATVGRVYVDTFRGIWSFAREPGASMRAFVRNVGASAVAFLREVASAPNIFWEEVRSLFRKL